jgi:Galactose oxidase, central domain/Kelch motif
MKRQLSITILILSLAACKKEIINESALASDNKQTSRVDDNTTVYHLTPSPVDPYEWAAITDPDWSGLENTIIPVNGSVFCRTAIYTDFDYYKLNNATKRWEYFNDFEIANVRQQYLFSYQSKMYFGMLKPGHTTTTIGNGFFSVDATTGVKTQLAAFPGTPVTDALSFVFGDKGYILGGATVTTVSVNQYWEYNFSTNQWTNKGNSPLGSRYGASGYVIDDKIYAGLGAEVIFVNGQKITRYKNDWLQFTPSSSYSAIKANFPGEKRRTAQGFIMNGSAWLGFGYDGANNLNDFWKYNPSSNSWTEQASWPGNYGNHGTIGTFSLGSAGYMVKGGIEEFWRFSNSPFISTY